MYNYYIMNGNDYRNVKYNNNNNGNNINNNYDFDIHKYIE